MAAVFIPSLGTTDVILRGEARLTLLNRVYKILKNLFQPLILNKYKLEKWFYKNRFALDIVTVAQGGTCAIIYTQCSAYIPSISTNVTHFTKHMIKMIQAMDTP